MKCISGRWNSPGGGKPRLSQPKSKLLVVFLILALIVLLTEEIVLSQDHPHQFYLHEVQNWLTGFLREGYQLLCIDNPPSR